MRDKYEILEQNFGYDSFRDGQEPLIDALAQKRDALGVMPTGAGKSLCFQVPALMLDGIALIISPLISLMKDQVGALRQADIPVAYLNSSLTLSQQRTVLENAKGGKYKIIYVAPERLLTQDFLTFATNAGIGFLGVDEAHCVSQWGQDFRPSYLRIRDFIDALPIRPVIGAFTATATARVREDIISLLGLRDPLVITTGFNRENLYFEVRTPKSKFASLERFLRERGDRSGIVYCLTRKTVDEVCEKLREQGYTAARYHAGLSATERQKSQELFQTDAVKILVATNAFGMGIDKSNVSFVVHYNMPGNMESYYQEAGRVGRDGSPAECLLLYSGQDVVTNRFLIEHSGDSEHLDGDALAEFKRHELEKLRQIVFYCHTQDCLRAYILRYFGESAPNHCGNCGGCASRSEKVDVTVEAQKILSCVKRMGERYGVKLLAETLRGSASERVCRLGLDSLSTFGVMKDMSEKQIREIVGYLLSDGFLISTGGDYPILKLGAGARDVLFGERKLSMNLSSDKLPKTKAQESQAKSTQVRNPRLYTKLQALRLKLAHAQSVPAYVIFPDATLREMCESLPKTRDELTRVSGVGQVKLQKYGDAFLELLREEAAGSVTET